MAIRTGFDERRAFRGLGRASAVCTRGGCGGELVRHSLGCGIAVDRCLRCFTHYDARRELVVQEPGRLRRFIDEIVSWREDD